MRKSWICAIAVTFCLSFAWVTGSAETLGFGYINTMRTNLRKSAGGPILFTCDQGDSLFITGQTTDAEGVLWYHVNTEQKDQLKTAWIQARYVDAGDTIFQNIISISAGKRGFLALRKDGQVVGVADENVGTRVFRDTIREWKDMEQIATGFMTYFGVGKNGTLAYCGNLENEDLRTAENVRLLACGDTMVAYITEKGELYPDWLETQPAFGEPFSGAETRRLIVTSSAVIALRYDGKVTNIALSPTAEVDLEVAAWENLLDIAVGSQSYSIQGLSGTREKQTLIGLGKNGTVVMLPDAGIPNAGSWTNLIDIAAGRDFVVGLRTDGTAVAAGADQMLQAQVETWQNIVAIDAGDEYCAGLAEDGTVMFAGDYRY